MVDVDGADPGGLVAVRLVCETGWGLEGFFPDPVPRALGTGPRRSPRERLARDAGRDLRLSSR